MNQQKERRETTSGAWVTFSSFLRDREKELVLDESGEAFASMTPQRPNGASSKKAKYKAQVGETKVRVKLSKAGEKTVKVELKINKAAVLAPTCTGAPSTTGLLTEFTLDDQENQPVDVSVLGEWLCRLQNGQPKKFVSLYRASDPDGSMAFDEREWHTPVILEPPASPSDRYSGSSSGGRNMSKVDELKAEIEKLSTEDVYKLVRWLSEKDWDNWDKEIEADSETGELDFLVREALDAKAKGTLEDL